MTSLLIRLFIKDPENIQNPEVRARYGVLGSVVGIVCNLLLSVLKFLLGVISNSIAITADAINNLSDTASGAVTLLGFRLSSKPADRDHPFGHGRIEYLCGLVIAFFILLVGFETGKSSFERILSSESAVFNPFVAVGLAASILVKLWLNFFNKSIGKRICSSAMGAVALDSISDALSTGVTLLSVILSAFTSFPIDGCVGILVSAFVIFSGIKVIKETITPLLGATPDKELVEKIRDSVLSYDGIFGIHDLIVHEYGPGRLFASLHAEVSSKVDIIESHELIDLIESEVSRKLNMEILIHMDPLEVDSPEICAMRDAVNRAVSALDASFTTHDFRVVPNGEFKNLIFDVAIPIDYHAPDSVVSEMVINAVSALDSSYVVKVSIDRSF